MASFPTTNSSGDSAQTAEFFSFGTNDLTQTCLGMSRADFGSLLKMNHKAAPIERGGLLPRRETRLNENLSGEVP